MCVYVRIYVYIYDVSAAEGRTKEALDGIMSLWQAGYAATDIIQTLFRVS